jgi:drug/metabolite transporter (DMT)-like permease
MNSALLGSAAALAWGTNDFLARFTSRSVGPLNSVLAVTIAGFVVLSVWLVVSGAEIRIVWPLLWLVVATGVLFAFGTLALFGALALGPLSIVAPLAGSYPAIAMFLAVAGGARPTLAAWLAVAVVMVGVVAVSQSGPAQEASGQIVAGKLKSVLGLAFLASLGFALSLASGQAAVPAFGNVQAAWLARIFGLIAILLLYLRPAATGSLPLRWLPILGVMGGLDVTALILIVAAGNLASPELATVTSSAFGAVSVVLARIFLKEPITLLQLIGIVMIFGGVAMLSSSGSG